MMSPKQRTENNNKHAVGTREEYEIIVKNIENRDQSTKYADQLNNECSMWKQELWNLLPNIWNT